MIGLEDLTINQLFKRKPLLGFKILLLLSLSLGLMILDRQNVQFHKMRQDLAVIVLPIQLLVDKPIQFFSWLSSSVTAQQNLLNENARLHSRELLLESKLQQLLKLKQENDQLRQLLKSTANIEGQTVVARLLAVSLDPSVAQVVLNKGKSRAVYQGQPVLDAHGVMGQVVEVGLLTSKVSLITDRLSAIPVRNTRNNIRAIAEGMGKSQLSLINVPDTTDIQIGDLFVASGLGLHFPVGYPVAIVTKVQHNPGQRFAMILLKPVAHLDQTQQVLLVWPNQMQLSQKVHQQLPNSVGVSNANPIH